MVDEQKNKLKKLYPHLVDDEYWKDYFEEKYNIKPKLSYSEMLNKPRPDDIPEKFKEKPKKKVEIYEEQF
jgi:hypothetical protein